MNLKSFRRFRLALSAIAWFSFLALQTFAQTEKAAISGKVTDSSGGVLQGAEIVVEPSGARTISDAQGQFFVNNLAPGRYTVTVTYVGFSELVKELDLSAGQPALVEASMSLSSVNTQVLVTSERVVGEAEAINRERTADNIVQVLPDDVIRSLPNANLADALGRLPSVSL